MFVRETPVLELSHALMQGIRVLPSSQLRGRRYVLKNAPWNVAGQSLRYPIQQWARVLNDSRKNAKILNVRIIGSQSGDQELERKSTHRSMFSVVEFIQQPSLSLSKSIGVSD